jgi:hypothetical protein
MIVDDASPERSPKSMIREITQNKTGKYYFKLKKQAIIHVTFCSKTSTNTDYSKRSFYAKLDK